MGCPLSAVHDQPLADTCQLLAAMQIPQPWRRSIRRVCGRRANRPSIRTDMRPPTCRRVEDYLALATRYVPFLADGQISCSGSYQINRTTFSLRMPQTRGLPARRNR